MWNSVDAGPPYDTGFCGSSITCEPYFHYTDTVPLPAAFVCTET